MSSSNEVNTVGWDIGGAHLKLAAKLQNSLNVFQWPCPLWQGIQELVASLDTAFQQIAEHRCMHHVTMTGELVDIFDTREQGVEKILATFVSRMPADDQVKVFASTEFVNVDQASANAGKVASANWLASGHLLTQLYKNALFVDMGSTTTDLLPISDGQLRNVGHSDAERLRSGELVYTGIVRSCVNTISHHMLYRGTLVPMMAENFATSADVYRILEQLPDHADSGETMDGQAKNKQASMRRLARMIGEDYSPQEEEIWEQAALYIAERQKKVLAEQIIEKIEQLPDKSIIVAAGAGRFLIKQIAQENNIGYSEFTDKVIPDNLQCSGHAADCAPAVALALL